MKPLGISEAPGFDVNEHLSRPENAGLLYNGFIKIPRDGVWKFHVSSDAGCHLRIHESQVIDDDFNHDNSEASGGILLKAGLHPFRLYYRTTENPPMLKVQWSGPGIEKHVIPDSALFRAKP